MKCLPFILVNHGRCIKALLTKRAIVTFCHFFENHSTETHCMLNVLLYKSLRTHHSIVLVKVGLHRLNQGNSTTAGKGIIGTAQLIGRSEVPLAKCK